ncbi:MAG: tetratricopeptide repeat protein [Bacteroidales bacterium]|nr:tetratricopeptide repeat protein [Bacteroidales bacterium]MCF8334408.1 tetratricopeptide repeat protein [Bacteroidales bacterium]
MKRKTIALTFILVLFLISGYGQINLEYFSRQGQKAVLEQNYTDAIENLNIVIRRKNQPFEEYFLRGIAKYNLGDHRGALNDFSQTLSIHPFYTQALHYRGVTYSVLMEKNKAIQDFNEALEFDPYNAKVLMSRGAVYLQMNKLDKALKDLDKAIMIDNDMALAYLNRAMVYKEKDKYPEALDDINEVINIDKFNKKAYAQRGLLKYEMGWYEKALADFNQALELAGNNPRFYYYRGLTKYQLNNIEGTLSDYSKVIELDPTNALTYYNRAILYSQVNEYDKAISDLNRVSQLNPNNVLTYFNRAHLYYEKGSYDKAIEDYTQAIELFPAFAKAYLMRASAKARKGNREGARRDRQKGNHIMSKHDNQKGNGSSIAEWVDSTYFKKIIEFEAEFRDAEATAGKISKRNMGISPEKMFRFQLTQDIQKEDRNRINSFATDFNMKNPLSSTLIVSNNKNNGIRSDLLKQRLEKVDSLINTSAPSPDLYMLKGMLHQMLQNYSSAMSAYTMAVVNNKDYYPAHLNRAVAIARMKEDLKNARGELQDVSLGKNNRLSDNYENSIDYTPVLEDLNKALEINSGIPEIWYNKGNIHLQMKNFTEAVNDYTRAIEKDPDFAEAYYNRGLTLIYLQDRNRGCLDMSKAGELGLKDAYKVIKRYCDQ